LIANNPPKEGELRIVNQVTSSHTVNELAQMVSDVAKRQGYTGDIEHIDNPRVEDDDHYYNIHATWLEDHGLKSATLTHDFIDEFMRSVAPHVDGADESHILPGYSWN
jgi:UDP-sulfoquinovose synthase